MDLKFEETSTKIKHLIFQARDKKNIEEIPSTIHLEEIQEVATTRAELDNLVSISSTTQILSQYVQKEPLHKEFLIPENVNEKNTRREQDLIMEA